MSRIKLNATFWRHQSCVPLSEDVVPASLFLKNRDYLVIDIETLRTFQEAGGPREYGALGVSVACAFDSKTQEWLVFRESELPKLFALCEKRLVVGYNIRGFDLPVLATYGLKQEKLDVFDLMFDIELLTRQRYVKLDSVAQGTLGVGKSADGLMAIEWWRSGQEQKVIDYCLQDVKVTRDVFEYGRKEGRVFIQRAPVDGQEHKQEVAVQWN